MTNIITQALISAIIMVESSGNPKAFNPIDGSRGLMGITDICRRDVNRIAGTNFRTEDCESRELSAQMFRIYIEYYATARRLGHEPTDEDRVRIWNGGPRGWERDSTKAYWEKVKKSFMVLRGPCSLPTCFSLAHADASVPPHRESFESRH